MALNVADYLDEVSFKYLTGHATEQRRRYEKAYLNLLYTDGVDFEFIDGATNEPV